MALDAELIGLKSAGLYRFERDKSEISDDRITVSNMRLVVGFSKRGPFNTVKLVTSTSQFIKLYGNIDRSLEKKGSYFHRSALAALSAGPILCLNLLNLDPDRDQVVEKSFSVGSGELNKYSVTLPLQSLYNTSKFWYASEDAFLNAVESCLGNGTEECMDWQNGVLHFTNVGKDPVSILVKKASDYYSKNYQLTLNEWYGDGNVPEYLNGTSYVSDYLVEVYVVKGDFGPALNGTPIASSIDIDNDYLDGSGDMLTMYKVDVDDSSDAADDNGNGAYKRFSADVNFQSFFDDRGFIRGKKDANLAKFLNLAAVEIKGHYVGSLIPNFVDKLGRNIWIQKLVNDDTDLIGVLCAENIDRLEDVDLEKDFIDETIDLIGNSVFSKVMDSVEETIPDMSFDFLSYKFDYEDKGQQVKMKTTGDVYMNTTDANADEDIDDVKHPFAWVKLDAAGNRTSTYAYANASYLKEDAPLYADKDGVEPLDTVGEIYEDVTPLVTEFVYLDNDDKYIDIAAKKAYEPNDNEVVLDSYADVTVGDYLLSDCYTEHSISHSRLTRVVEVKNVYEKNSEGRGKKCGILVICSDKVDKRRGVANNMVVKVTPIDKVCDRLQWVCLNGFQMSKEVMPDGTNERQNEILDMIRETPEYSSTVSNLYKSLIDRDYVQFRYVVDGFGLGLEEECKDVYTLLCQDRKSALAIVNCPSMMDFKKSLSPSFTNIIGGVESEYIAAGGNLDKNPEFLFSLPTLEHGASWGAYYYPYLRVTDQGAAKSVPPAAYVSNLFIQKYARGFAWSIVAGQKRGVIVGNQVAGVEDSLVQDDRDWLEPVGINSIIWENGVGVEVYGNKTAKQTPVSALSSIHVREAAIYIQDGVEIILRRYNWEFNTAQTRLEIKTLVDNYLGSMKSNGGLYDFRTVMDTTNNTSDVIDHNMGVIDIYVEIVRGLEIIAQRLTILKTGAIEAGGFDE